MKRRNKQKPAVYRLVFSLLLLIALLAIAGGKYIRPWQMDQKVLAAEASQLPGVVGQVQGLTDENQALKEKLERSATYQTPQAVQSLSRYYIEKYFGAEAPRVEKVMWCESGLDNRRVHINKDGSKDSGLFQIHEEKAHVNNLQKMYGVSYDIGSMDLDISAKYAKFLWDRSPNNWVCNRIAK